MGFPGGSDGKESTFNTGDLGLTPGLGRSPGGGHGNPLQCSCLENSHGQRSLVGYSPWGHQESDGTQRLSTHVLRTYSTSTGYPVIRMCVCVGSQFATPWTIARPAPLCMGFPRQAYWSWLPFLSPGNLPNPGGRTCISRIAGGFFTAEPSGKPSKEVGLILKVRKIKHKGI